VNVMYGLNDPRPANRGWDSARHWDQYTLPDRTTSRAAAPMVASAAGPDADHSSRSASSGRSGRTPRRRRCTQRLGARPLACRTRAPRLTRRSRQVVRDARGRLHPERRLGATLVSPTLPGGPMGFAAAGRHLRCATRAAPSGAAGRACGLGLEAAPPGQARGLARLASTPVLVLLDRRPLLRWSWRAVGRRTQQRIRARTRAAGENHPAAQRRRQLACRRGR